MHQTPTAQALYQKLPTFFASETARMMQVLDVDGFVLIKNVLSPEECQLACRKIDELKPFHWDHSGVNHGVKNHYKNVFNRDLFWLPYLDKPGVIELAEAGLGDQCHVVGQTAWRTHPGYRGIGVHLDYLAMEVPEAIFDQGFRLPIYLTTAHFYLNSVPLSLGPTYVIPGSHRAGRKPKLGERGWNNRLPQPVLCDAGDVLFFRSDIWHAGGENTSIDTARYLLQVHYGRREMAQHFSPFMSWQFNSDVLAMASPRQLRLLGDHAQGPYD